MPSKGDDIEKKGGQCTSYSPTYVGTNSSTCRKCQSRRSCHEARRVADRNGNWPGWQNSWHPWVGTTRRSNGESWIPILGNEDYLLEFDSEPREGGSDGCGARITCAGRRRRQYIPVCLQG